MYLLLELCLGFFVIFGILKPENHPQQWFLSASVLVLIGVALSFPRKQLGWLLLLAIVNLTYTLAVSWKLKKDGGGGWHLATLESQNEVFSKIVTLHPNPKIEYLNHSFYGSGGSEYLFSYFKLPASSSVEKKYYIYFFENEGVSIKDLGYRSQLNSLKFENVRQHRIYFNLDI